MWAAAFPVFLTFQSYNHFGTPNTIACTNDGAAVTWNYGAESGIYEVGPLSSCPPNSRHSGGVNEAYSDGSVRFIKNSVNPTSWWALGTRNGGEVVSSDSY